MPFTCSICGEESTRICARCTKDACNNHLCDKCRRCSDCCECEVALSEPVYETVRPVHRPVEVADDEEEDMMPAPPEPEEEPEPEVDGPVEPEVEDEPDVAPPPVDPEPEESRRPEDFPLI
jgi:hypothetical protein